MYYCSLLASQLGIWDVDHFQRRRTENSGRFGHLLKMETETLCTSDHTNFVIERTHLDFIISSILNNRLNLVFRYNMVSWCSLSVDATEELTSMQHLVIRI